MSAPRKYTSAAGGAHAALQPHPKYPHRHTIGHRGATTMGASGITATAGGATSTGGGASATGGGASSAGGGASAARGGGRVV